MSFINWNLQPSVVLSTSSVIPVIVIRELEQAIPLASALLAGGIKVLEVTLRTEVALDAIQRLTSTFPDALIGAGTVTTPGQLQQVIEAGARFAISPGQTQSLLMTGCDGSIPLIPGVSSVSDVMEGLNLGYTHFKFFPAAAAGGISMLKAIYGPFPQARFCPTGGINEENFMEYLALPNVSCVGGSWIVPDAAVAKENWPLITKLAQSVQGELKEV
ncbi:bifunctional 4-hydroxy-2-oxoglutarate aldolase/2-dehydro-3-deoxy-phosphogluconate aldolase [Legionella fallonii]|uniref:2-dehydro-3-deoxy-phosphogluconate aldolase n=1 Tax=Legionella fallonii LLAP-10 TaxID=1212491 RepID=A0A098G7X0_9GAMM|nr:bifunctional 4-hydroxy-2-oxoglutarate aldolase/2-dehydro-3-deoxy-phosphogluconate aldolase [Legionella fallonii]CEG58059.1 multifunctional 2-keto-3-deoxygluconate 6-phosphate aldolase and 2-keto-4-hydroxyglutarate aldolase and oxaloacetate decarboxylase [Legionella fallonii LLAP-10]